MSAPFFTDDVEFLQRLLSTAGCYSGPIHGMWDGTTDQAEQVFATRCDELASEFGIFDARSERCIRTLHPKAQQLAREFLKRVRTTGIDVRIISGTRSYAEQTQLYRRGRFGNPPPRVTNARAGQSNHNFGIAWDVGIFQDGRYLQESPLYDKSADVGLLPGLEWGGHWKSFQDRPHYQLALPLQLAEVRRRFESGETLV